MRLTTPAIDTVSAHTLDTPCAAHKLEILELSEDVELAPPLAAAEEVAATAADAQRCDDQQIEVRSLHPGRIQRTGDRLSLDLQRRLALLLVEDLPLVDAGPLDDPLAGRVDHLLEIAVGQHPRGNSGRCC